MQITTVGTYPITLGWLLAFLILIIAILLLVLSMIDLRLGLLIGGLALARLI
jgi:hypothetical protein